MRILRLKEPNGPNGTVLAWTWWRYLDRAARLVTREPRQLADLM